MGITAVRSVPAFSQTLLADLDRVGRKHQRWTVDAYFELDGVYLVEYCRGTLDILPMPTMTHQRVAARVYDALRAAAPPGSLVLFAGTRVKVAEEVFREPDVLYIPSPALPDHKQYTESATLVIEVLSDSTRRHDLETKRREYAGAGITEYWLVDPEPQRISVLKLDDDAYVVHGEFGPGDRATSALLPSFNVDVTEVFAGV
jgi:Uma2 family endonuclease